MSEKTVFYTEVDNAVSDALNLRKKYYSGQVKSSAAHTWLYEKMAFATAKAFDKDKPSEAVSLSTPLGGGLGPRGLYNKYKDNDKDTGYLPRPHLNSVKLTNKGSWGTIRECEISFSVYSLADLEAIQMFFSIGKQLTVDYGWTKGGAASGPSGTFTGIIYNFNWSANPDGSFACTTFGMSEGISVLGANVGAATPNSAATGTDASDAELEAKSLLMWLDTHILSLFGRSGTILSESFGIYSVSYPESWAHAAESGENKDATTKSADNTTPKKHFYITLEALINAINKQVLQAISSRFKDVVIKCNSEVTRGWIPNNYIIPVDPTVVIFPGSTTYKAFGFAIDLFPSEKEISKQWVSGDLSKTLFSIEWIKKTLTDMDKAVREADQKSVNNTIGKFLNKCFDALHYNSADRFKLSISLDPTDKTGKTWVICDTNYFSGDNIDPYTITAITDNSIVRSLSLVSKVPQEYATVAYVGEGKVGSQSGTGLPRVLGPSENSVSPDKSKLEKDFDNALTNVSVGGLNESRKKKLRDAMINIDTFKDKNKYTQIPFPVDFSCTLDGIEGFIFGNTITTNYLPAVYKQAGVVWTITNVEHTISENDWVTSLSTVCRLRPAE